jgi:predicted DNA-binding transcriptional regulator YafY
MSSSLRVALEILRRIPRRRKITTEELHQQLVDAGFARDIRSVQRQLDALCEAFEDIERDDRNKPYGYRWLDGARGMTVPGLTPQESLLLSLAEAYLKSLLPDRLMKSLSGFFVQARRNLGPDRDSARLERQWPEKVRVVPETQPLLPPKIDPAVFEAVSNALYENRWLHIDYRNARGVCGKSEVMPLGLAQQGPRLYLVCRYQDFDNERSLALHRIQSARLSSRTFERPAGFSLRDYVDDGRFGFGEGERVELRFHISKPRGAHLLETPLSTDQKVIEHPEEYEIRATVVDSGMLEWWLLGFGEDVWDVEKRPAGPSERVAARKG